MGFEQNDVVDALALNRNDFEKALDSLTNGKLYEQRLTAGLIASSRDQMNSNQALEQNQPMEEREKSAFENDEV